MLRHVRFALTGARPLKPTQALPIIGAMSLETALARISQIEAAFSPRAAAGATAPSATPSAASTAATAATATSAGTSGTNAVTNFATMLQSAIAPTAAGSPGTVAATGGISPVAGTTAGASPMVQIAQTQVGQTEQPPGSNDSPAIAMYRTATAGAAAGEPWCAYFVSWVARQAGEPLGAQGQGFGYVGDIWNWAQQTGRAITNGPGVVPKPGDLIVFGDQHVGIVKQVLPNGSIETIEGNYNNQVSQVVRGPSEATGYVQM